MRIDEPRWPSPGAGGGGVSNILREMFIMGVDNLTREDRGGRGGQIYLTGDVYYGC